MTHDFDQLLQDEQDAEMRRCRAHGHVHGVKSPTDNDWLRLAERDRDMWRARATRLQAELDAALSLVVQADRDAVLGLLVRTGKGGR